MNYDQDSEGNEYGTWLNKTDPGTGALCAIHAFAWAANQTLN